MAFKEVLSGSIARTELKAGVDAGANIARVTIGPNGRNVMVDRGIVTPLITNDGFKAIQALVLKIRAQNMGLDILKNVVLKTSETARGARTASIILTQAMFEEGLKHLTPEMNVVSLKKNIAKVAKLVVEELKKGSKNVSSIEDIKNVATISSESEEIGLIIASALSQIGKDGVITSEEVPTRTGISFESAQGMKIDRGWVDSYMVTNYDKMTAEYTDVGVILVDKKLLMADEIKDLISLLGEKGVGEILLIAEDIQGEVLNMCILNKLKGGFKIVGVKAPGTFGSNRKEIMKDLAILTGATVLGESIDLKTADISSVGFASKIIVGETSSTIVGNPERKIEVEERISSLKQQKKDLKSKIDIENMEDRISRLSGGAAIVKIGTATTVGTNYTKDKIDDAITESKAAYEEGIIAGGGSALAKAAYNLTPLEESLKNGNKEEMAAYQIVLKAIQAPFLQIVKNSGKTDSEGVLKKIVDASLGNPNNGYDAVKDRIVDDMFEAGIIDALKVVRIALENAAEGVGTLLTTEVVEAEENVTNNKNN